MSLKPDPGLEEQGKKMVKEKEDEVMGMALAKRDTEADLPRFKQKMGSVFPKKRRSVKGLMFDYVRHGLGSTCADTSSQVENNATASSAALFPEESNTNIINAKRVYPHTQLHGYKHD